MKKLLSLLSVLTISGTAVPTTIAASPYQKEGTIKNSDINYSQTNSLKTLNRNKRQLDDPYSFYGTFEKEYEPNYSDFFKKCKASTTVGGAIGGAIAGSTGGIKGTIVGSVGGVIGGCITDNLGQF